MSPDRLRAETPDVRVRVVAPPNLPAGGRTLLIVEMTLGAKWHVNSHAPAETFLIPTDVSLTTTTGTLSAIRYPRHTEKRFAFSERPMLVYEGTVRFETDFSLPTDSQGRATISGTLSYQACNDQQCFPPAKLPLEADVVISQAIKPDPNR